MGEEECGRGRGGEERTLGRASRNWGSPKSRAYEYLRKTMVNLRALHYGTAWQGRICDSAAVRDSGSASEAAKNAKKKNGRLIAVRRQVCGNAASVVGCRGEVLNHCGIAKEGRY